MPGTCMRSSVPSGTFFSSFSRNSSLPVLRYSSIFFAIPSPMYWICVELSSLPDLLDVLAQVPYARRGPPVRDRLEPVLATRLREQGEPLQELGDVVVPHHFHQPNSFGTDLVMTSHPPSVTTTLSSILTPYLPGHVDARLDSEDHPWPAASSSRPRLCRAPRGSRARARAPSCGRSTSRVPSASRWPLVAASTSPTVLPGATALMPLF